MSAYKVIKTQIKNGESLCRALTELGIKFTRSAILTQNSVTLKGSWGATFGGHDEQVAIAISKEDAVRAGIGNYDGLGFKWDVESHSYVMVQDHYDENSQRITTKINGLKQRYGIHEVRRQAQAKGYGIQEHKNLDGSVTVTLIRR